MSSIRNSLHRRTHKERSQLSHRSKLGILEKHKDYVLRARDFHSKQDRIRRLKQKASEKNKDEFHFGMVNQRTNAGIHIQDRGNTSVPLDMVKLLKTQDENYIRTMRTRGQKKIDKIKSQLTALADLISPGLSNDPDGEEEDGSLNETEIDVLRQAGIFKGKQAVNKGRRNHIVFVANEEEVNKYIGSSTSDTLQDIEMSEQEPAEEVDLGWKVSKKIKRSTKEEVEEEEKLRMTELREEAKIHRSRLLKELAARLARDTQLRYAERELEMQRQLMGKGGNRKIRGVERVDGGDEDEEEDEDEVDARKGKPVNAPVQDKVYNPRVYKWRAERKR